MFRTKTDGAMVSAGLGKICAGNGRMRSFCLLVFSLLSLLPGAARAFMIPTAVAYSRDLVSVVEVRQWMQSGQGKLFLLEVGAENEGKHLPGAQQVWHTELEAAGYPYGGICPSKPEMESILSRLGVLPTDSVVLYDAYGNADAARMWWILRRYGHANVFIMDGGKVAWEANMYPFSGEIAAPTPSQYTFSGETDNSHYASKEDVAAALSDTNTILIDVRSPQVSRDGEAMARGHIPGAIQVDFNEFVLSDNEERHGLPTYMQLSEIFTRRDINPNKNIIVYSHSGINSSLAVFVLSEILNYPKVKNYDGSWAEWHHFSALPVEVGMTGKGPGKWAQKEAVATSSNEKSYWDVIKESYSGYWNYLVEEVSMSYTYKPKWQNFFYGLIVLSLFFYGLELIIPWRKNQGKIRKDFWLDAFYMFFNVFLFGFIIFAALENVLVEGFNDFLGLFGLENIVAIKLNELAVWQYFILLFVIADFIQWNVHRLLHRISWLWEFHKLHHSVEEMGFAAHLRFHWMETLVYKAIQAIPLTMLGYNLADLFVLHIFTLAWGHFNHSNITVPGRASGAMFGGLVGLGLALTYTDGGLLVLAWVGGGLMIGGILLGPVMKYIFNSPEMHIWHHARDLPEGHRYGVNFGLTLAIWDYIFGTAYIPFSGRDIRLGFSNLEKYPKTFFRQITYGFTKRKDSDES